MVEVLKAFKSKPTNEDESIQADQGKGAQVQSHLNVSKAGWISPQYALSKQVTLDMDLVERNRCISLQPDIHDSEYYKLLRTQIQQQLSENGWNTVMITSAGAGEGKTVTAVNLAAMFAREYSKTVLLVDADLKKQSIHKYLGYNQDSGLANHLLEDTPLQDIIVWPGVEKLTIISGGLTLKSSSELLNSPRMHALLQEMKTRYADRYLFFDAPPLLGSTDALALAPVMDAIVVVVQAGKTPMTDVQKALSLLPKEKVLGLVMNRQI